MSRLHDMELVDTLEAIRPKKGVRYDRPVKAPPEIRAEIKLATDQYQRIRAACSTVPSLNADEVAARISLTVRQLRNQNSMGAAALADRRERQPQGG